MVVTDLHHTALPRDVTLGCRQPQKHQGYCNFSMCAGTC